MSFLGGLFVASMFANNHSQCRYNIKPMGLEEFGYALFTGGIVCLITYYIIAICFDRAVLINNTDDGSWGSATEILSQDECEISKTKDRIKTLQEKPKFFLSPLYIAKFTLQKQINAELIELKAN
jgi:hypothetical protein